MTPPAEFPRWVIRVGLVAYRRLPLHPYEQIWLPGRRWLSVYESHRAGIADVTTAEFGGAIAEICLAHEAE
jgi:hypothetical protein